MSAAFTPEERTRASEIRGWAERPEHVLEPTSRCDVEHHGGVFHGIRTAFSIVRTLGRRWRVLSCSIEGFLATPDYKTVLAIATDLLGFDADGPFVRTLDPATTHVVGLAQPVELPYPMQRTDGLWIVYDPELPPGQRTALGKTFTCAQEAEQLSRILLGLERSAERPS